MNIFQEANHEIQKRLRLRRIRNNFI